MQHYIEEIGQADHLRLVSTSDVFTPTGGTKIGVISELSVKKIDDETCEFTNTVHSSARRNSWASSANKEFRGRFSRPLGSGFQGQDSKG